MCIEMSRCAGLSLYHNTRCASQESEPVAPVTSSGGGGGDETGECFGQWRRVAGWGADERNTPSQLETKERPAKGPIAQSWLTLQCTSHTYIHNHTHSHHLFTLRSAFSLLPFTHQPHHCFHCLSLLSLCHIPFFSFHFPPLSFMHHTISACTFPLWLHPVCVWKYSQLWEGHGQFRCKPISKIPPSPPLLLVVTLGNAPMPSTSSAVYARMMRFPLAGTAVMKAGCHKSIHRVVDYVCQSCFLLTFKRDIHIFVF